MKVPRARGAELWCAKCHHRRLVLLHAKPDVPEGEIVWCRPGGGGYVVCPRCGGNTWRYMWRWRDPRHTDTVSLELVPLDARA